VELAREVVTLLGLLAEEKAQQIQIEGDAELTVNADRLVLQRGVGNIIENAIKHGPGGSRILILIAGTGNYVDLSVEDRGETIPEALREKIFERFFRIDASRSRDVGGSGLGLAIAKWAIEVNGGSVSLRPGQKGGNLFLVRIPAASEIPVS
jgi:signal transduction histidine kinase